MLGPDLHIVQCAEHVILFLNCAPPTALHSSNRKLPFCHNRVLVHERREALALDIIVTGSLAETRAKDASINVAKFITGFEHMAILTKSNMPLAAAN